ncbi:MAG: prepilin-type N-terminal cleavage/methylation domain-containing protein [Sumerlaeia bacterium]
MTHSRRSAFTLIELLIVVAIIAILAAIAVPNFLEAQTRSKVSRAQSDLRTLATAFEAYVVDYNHYPPFYGTNPATSGPYGETAVFFLTTPIAYITSVPADPFQAGEPQLSANPQKNFTEPWGPSYRYFHYASDPPVGFLRWDAEAWSLRSMGPDLDFDLVGDPADNDGIIAENGVYDATNGTVSNGDVVRYGGSSSGIPGIAP